MVSQQRASFVREAMRKNWAARMRHYDQHAAPNTARFAAVLLDLVRPQPGERVLDVATGSGVVAVAAARLVGPSGSIVATDLVPEWEDLFAERCAAAGVRNAAFRAMGAEALDLPDETFDVALCQFGLMFVPDPLQALREMRRVLRQGGRLGIVVWSTAERAVCVGLLDRLLAPLLAAVPPEAQLPTALSLSEPGLIERLIAEAGFGALNSERRVLDYISEAPEEAWRFRVIEGPPAVREAVARLHPDERRQLHHRFVAELERYRQGGEIRLPSEAIYVTARKGSRSE
jgi:ubiquinone/menaquinone biosynthesis C-methylase UbiE